MSGLREAGFELVPALTVFCFAQVQPHMEVTRQSGEAPVLEGESLQRDDAFWAPRRLPQ